MLKGLEAFARMNREWLPIIGNSQDMRELAATIQAVLTEHPNAHGLLLSKHGLYSWGKDLREAEAAYRNPGVSPGGEWSHAAAKVEETDHGSANDLRSESNIE